MKRFTGWRSSAAEDDGQQASPPEHSPTRSQLSSNSTSSRGGSSSLRSGYAATKSREQSPARFGAASGDTLGAATGSSSGGAVVAVSSKKMLKIGANVRFRGDVMECNTVVLCGRLQVCVRAGVLCCSWSFFLAYEFFANCCCLCEKTFWVFFRPMRQQHVKGRTARAPGHPLLPP